MKCCSETQAHLAGTEEYRCLTGCVTISPIGCGSAIQVHIRHLPFRHAFLGFCIELCGRRYPLPELMVCDGEALMSVYTCAFRPEETVGARVILTRDPHSPCGCCPVACGTFAPLFSPGCCPPDPRPLFAAPIHRSPGGSTFY